MIPFSGLSRFSGHFGGDGPSPLNRDTTVVVLTNSFHLFWPKVKSPNSLGHTVRTRPSAALYKKNNGTF